MFTHRVPEQVNIVDISVTQVVTSHIVDRTDIFVFNRRVRVIDWSLVPRDARLVDKLVVECEATKEGGSATLEEYYADFVISTLPMAVLKQCHNSIFYPALDEEKVNRGIDPTEE